jgi:hypothetical protein
MIASTKQTKQEDARGFLEEVPSTKQKQYAPADITQTFRSSC